MLARSVSVHTTPDTNINLKNLLKDIYVPKGIKKIVYSFWIVLSARIE